MTITCPQCNKPLNDGAKFCPSCGYAVASSLSAKSAEQPRTDVPSSAKLIKNPMSKKAKLAYSGLAFGICAVFIAIFVDHLPGGAHPVIAGQPEVAMASMFTDVNLTLQPIKVRVAGGKISFPLALLQEKKFVEFEYINETHSVPLLAYISPEGKLVTSIRLCEPCNSMSFRIEGTELACGNCETRWKLNNLEGLQGSCQKYAPAPIPSTLVGNEVQIDEAVVKNWKIRI